MAESYFKGYSSNVGSGSSRGSDPSIGSSFFSGYSDNITEEDDEERNKELRRQEEQRKREEALKNKGDGLKQAAEGVGGFFKSVGEGIAAPFKRTAEGVAEVVNEVTGGAERERQQQLQADQDSIQLIKSLGQKMREAKTEEEKNRYREAIRKVSGISDEQYRQFQERQGQIIERTDPIKGAAAVGEIGLNVLTGGTVGAVTKGASAAAKATNIAQKLIAPRGIKQGIASGAAQGALYGAAGTAEQKGGDATVGDYAAGVAGGAAVGGVTGGLIPAALSKKGLPSITSTKFGEKVAQTKVGQKITDLKDGFVAKIVDDTNMIKKQFKGLTDSTTGRKVADEIEDRVTNVRQFAALSQSRLENNQAFQELVPLIAGDKKRYKEFSEFINNKQQAINQQKLGREGSPAIPKGTPEQEEAYRLLNQATKDDVQYLFDNGKITKEQYDKWIADPDYTRVQKEVLDDQGKQYGKSGLVSGSSVTQQKLKGSTKKSVDPFASYEDWSRQVTLEVEKNNLAKYLRDQALERGLTKSIRVADKVIERTQLYGEAAQLRPLRNKLGRLLRSQEKYTRRIQAELDSLNKQGLEAYLKRERADIQKPILSGERQVIKNPKRLTSRELTGTLTTEQFSRKLSNKETKGLVNQIIAAEPSKLLAIKSKIARREPKLANALDEITGIKNQYDSARTEVADLVNRARQLSDLDPRGQDTLKVFENGVRELYTLDPAAAKQLAGVADLELKAIADWALLPSRILRGGATQLNPAFAVPNFIRDQISSGILSRNAAATHNPLVFLAGLKEAVVKPTLKATAGRIPGAEKVAGKLWEPTETYKLWQSRNANITRADLSRNLKQATRQSLEDLGVKNESFLRKYENIVSAGEKATRYQNFLGTYKNALKKSKSPEEALSLANRAARDNSINFSNRGEIATFMKLFNPFFNASVQGSRTLAKTLKERPVGTSLKIGTTLMAPVAASAYYNLSDPDRAAVYANIPDHERAANLIMVLGGNRGYIKVPLPPGLREFANPLRDFVESEYLGDRQSLLETAKDLLVDPFSPIGTTAGEVVSNLVPQAVRPGVEIAANQEFYSGNKIIPDNLKDLKPEEQVFDSTPQVYKDIGRLLGISPLQVRKVVQGYTAGAGEGALTSVDLARGAETGGRSTPEQLTNRFFDSEVSGSGRVSSKFYETYTPLKAQKENISKRITDAIKAGDINKANELARDVNQRIDSEKERLGTTYGRFEVNLDPLFERLDSLKIPMDGESLSLRSIKSREKQ